MSSMSWLGGVLLLIVIVPVFVLAIRRDRSRRFGQAPFPGKQSESEPRLSRGVRSGRTDQRTETAQPTRSDTMPRIREASADGIFISYRRQDEPNFAGRLYDRLVVRFGRDRVFMDIDSIEPGLDFAEVIHDSIKQCRIVLVIIGKEWAGVAGAQGQSRLHSEDDYVRLEVEAALARKIRVIPILIEGATMPRSSDLPSPMDSLARRNAVEMSHARFRLEAERLIETLERVMKSESGAV